MKQIKTEAELNILLKDLCAKTTYIKELRRRENVEDPLRSEIKEWIERLESGKYDQATEKLFCQDEQGYCCLGVMFAEELDTVDLDWGQPSDLGSEVTEPLYPKKQIFRDVLFPFHNNDNWYTSDLEGSLIALNDNYKATFEQIAGILRYKFKIYD